MNKNVKKLWCEALRSGSYKQIKHRLSKEGGFCALGVLCDISGLGEWVDISGTKHMPSFRSYHIFVSPIFCTNELPLAVQTWAGEMSPLFSFSPEDRIGSYSDILECNDNLGYTFEEIADVVEFYF